MPNHSPLGNSNNKTDQSIEYQYLQTQLQNNRYVKSVMINDISNLMALITQKQQTINEIEKMDMELEEKIKSLEKNGSLIYVDYFGEFQNG